MKRKSLILLVVVLLIMAIGFCYISGSNTSVTEDRGKYLFGDIKAEDIGKIEIVQGSESLSLERKNGIWSLPAKHFYPADFSKVQSFVLKLLDQRLTQEVTANSERFRQLGVDEESVLQGRTKITLSNAASESMGSVYLGESRKEKSNTGVPTPSGQYVRNAADSTVYLVSPPISAVTAVADWLNSSISDVLRSRVYSVEQFELKDGQQTLDFEIVRADGEADSTSGNAFKLKDVQQNIPEAEDGYSAVLQVASGLENLRFSEVYNVADAHVKDISFTTRTVYKLTDGLVYIVDTRLRGDKLLAKLNVKFDSTLAAELKAKSDETEKSKEPVEPAKENQDVKSPTSATTVVSRPVFADDNSAAAINQSLQSWVFEFPKYVESKFRQTKSQMTAK